MSEGLKLKGSEERLKEELKELRSEVRKLTTKVDSQQDEIEILCVRVEELSACERKKEVEAEERIEQAVARASSEIGSYSVVEVCSEPPRAAGIQSGGSETSWGFREEVARGIGAFLRRALSGQARGSSGRDRLKLPSAYYLVVRDCRGRIYEDPVLVHSRFSAVRSICHNGEGWADSIFVGVPPSRGTDRCPCCRPRLAFPHPLMDLSGTAASGGGTGTAGELDGAPLGDEAILRPLDCLVQQDSHIDTDYRVASFEVTQGESDLCSIICIAYIGGKLLVAVPEEMWHQLPTRSLTKAVLCGVAACSASQRESEEDILTEIKVWVGYLDKRLEEELLFLQDEGMSYHFGSVSGGDFLLPYGPALIEVANEHFAFVTAESGLPLEPEESGGQKVEERLENLENTLAALSANVSKLVGAPSVMAPKEKQRAKPKGGETKKQPAQMDSGTVKAALDAGVPMAHLQEMGKILRARPARLEEVPRKPIAKKTEGELGETKEEEEAEGPELIPDAGGLPKAENGPLEEAVLRLTQIATKLTHTDQKKDKLGQILEGASASSQSGESYGVPGTRKNAAALRALQRMVKEDPKYIYEHIEGNLHADFMGRAPTPGEPWTQGTTVRGWLVSRSRVQNFQQHVRWCWSLAGIWDALIAGQTSEARARCALMMAAADQASLDGGNWAMSTVSLLEPVPPYQAFSTHSSPAPGEMQHSALYDVRWAEVFLTHLKEMDSFIDAKKKLGGGEDEEL